MSSKQRFVKQIRIESIDFLYGGSLVIFIFFIVDETYAIQCVSLGNRRDLFNII